MRTPFWLGLTPAEVRAARGTRGSWLHRHHGVNTGQQSVPATVWCATPRAGKVACGPRGG
ncbi:hypothetical protein GFS60_08043 (plasmid) [Rhodococcus sp. WAY2]|nr:hypothetical protein GFS60_08043 [Rhodococcus sp. WAY2]